VLDTVLVNSVNILSIRACCNHNTLAIPAIYAFLALVQPISGASTYLKHGFLFYLRAGNLQPPIARPIANATSGTTGAGLFSQQSRRGLTSIAGFDLI